MIKGVIHAENSAIAQYNSEKLRGTTRNQSFVVRIMSTLLLRTAHLGGMDEMNVVATVAVAAMRSFQQADRKGFWNAGTNTAHRGDWLRRRAIVVTFESPRCADYDV